MAASSGVCAPSHHFQATVFGSSVEVLNQVQAIFGGLPELYLTAEVCILAADVLLLSILRSRA